MVMKKKKTFTFLIVIVIALLSSGIYIKYNQFAPSIIVKMEKVTPTTDNPQTNVVVSNESEVYLPGTIVFSTTNRSPRYTRFLLMDGDGNKLMFLGSYTGSTAWSPDGLLLAVGCKDPSRICILNMSNWYDYHAFPNQSTFQLSQLVSQELIVPGGCNLPSGGEVRSISWSPDGQKLAIVCNWAENSKVCLLNVDGTSNCWEDSKGKSVFRAVWSPMDAVLAVDHGGLIEITNEKGEKLLNLTSGFNPAWSPDGKQIAFAGYYGQGPQNGIAIINKDGSNLRWLYQQPEQGDEGEYLSAIHYDGSRISWSPDGKYLVYSAHYYSDYENTIFRQDITSGEIRILVDTSLFPYLEDANWGAKNILRRKE